MIPSPRLAALALLLVLGGCATAPPTVEAPVSPAPAPAALPPVVEVQPQAPASAPVLPAVIPRGPLQPITAGEAASGNVAALQPPADLWDRIRRGFAMPDLDTDLVRNQEQWYTSRPEYIQRMTERSRKYLFHIVEELERRNMPTELALLPFIESAFNPQAVSSARAAGMWQFMPATGTDFDLKQNVFRDDRRDVLASTRAALDYLEKLHSLFGDWHLALAAYNWGQGNVGRAIARSKQGGLATGYLDLPMPDETRLYVPKLQAVKNIVANPQHLRAELPLIENHPYFQTVTVTRDIDVELAARLADVRLEDFRALNPSMSRPVILAAGTPEILLPWDNAKIFERNFKAHTEGQYASWTAWSAPATMSVTNAARQVGMSEADLRQVNSIPPRMLIKAGSVLIVPRTVKMQQDVTSHMADNGQLSLSPEPQSVTRRSVIKAGKRDTVASIARRYRLNVAQVAEWNEVSTKAAFKLGEQVVVYLPVRVGPPRGPRASTRSRGAQPTRAAAPKRAAAPRRAVPARRTR